MSQYIFYTFLYEACMQTWLILFPDYCEFVIKNNDCLSDQTASCSCILLITSAIKCIIDKLSKTNKTNFICHFLHLSPCIFLFYSCNANYAYSIMKSCNKKMIMHHTFKISASKPVTRTYLYVPYVLTKPLTNDWRYLNSKGLRILYC